MTVNFYVFGPWFEGRYNTNSSSQACSIGVKGEEPTLLTCPNLDNPNDGEEDQESWSHRIWWIEKVERQ